MTPLSDAGLESLLDGLESDRVERKESFTGSATTTVREAACAFANDLPGHAAPGVAPMHRYEATNAPVRVYWFDDRIEIHNPGGPFGSVTQENFGRPGVTDYRNPNLAEALRALGFVQRFGAGIAIARRALCDRLRFETGPSAVAAIVAGPTP